jgi:hypothetical protein
MQKSHRGCINRDQFVEATKELLWEVATRQACRLATFKPEAQEAAEFLWDRVRCLPLHRFGARFQNERLHKYGNTLTLTDATLEGIERSIERPFSDPSIRRDEKRTVLWLETFYWGIR